MLELGVGFNTPTIIRFPFEKMAFNNSNFHLVRFNMDELAYKFNLGDKVSLIPRDMSKTLDLILD